MVFTRKAAADLLHQSVVETGFDSIAPVNPVVGALMPEVQNAIRAATESAIFIAAVMNRVIKTDEQKSVRGSYAAPAVDSLRAALMFASAGLDISLKRLVRHATPSLVDEDEKVEHEFQKWATSRIQNEASGVDPKALIELLLTRGATPRETLINRWCDELTRNSAQSVDRVNVLASALGVTSQPVRQRISRKATATVLQEAFDVRNLVAHELDITEPEAETRKALEHIRKYRSKKDIARWCRELLDVTQQIANDVASRLSSAQP